MTFICYQPKIRTQHALTESKNIELSLRLLAIDYYAQDKRIYDPLRPDGLIEGAAEQVRDLSGAEGELILTSWDANRQAARSFTYRTGKLIVFYNYDEQHEEHWSLYYRFRDLVKTD
ncbi:MAG: hypothetical protein PHV18_11545 [Lachnospiraceae bacterium]|nr:hypothetical protein [Lachnospiraceae bacterium]